MDLGYRVHVLGSAIVRVHVDTLTYIMHVHGGQVQEIGRSGAMEQPGNKRECRKLLE